MTRNPDVPDRWQAARPSQPGGAGYIPGSPPIPSSSPPKRPIAPPGSGTTGQGGAKPARRTDGARSQKKPRQAGEATGRDGELRVPSGEKGARGSKGEVSPSAPGAPGASPEPSPLKHQLYSRLGFATKWPFWAAVTVMVSGGVGFLAVALLFKLPAVPNCPATFWPTASASLRLYCAQVAANKQTPENLLEAIALVNSLPEDHPLRPAINGYIEQWSQDILKLGEQAFQAGKLQEAIALARKIPAGVTASGIVENRIDRWQTMWSQAEQIYQQAEQQLRLSNWHKAFEQAVRLTRLGNTYWSKNKFDELAGKIQTAKEESAKLDRAYKLAKSGGLDELLEAVKLASAIGPNSYANKEAKDLIADCGNKLISLAQGRVDRRDWQGVLQIAKKIPASLNIQGIFKDFTDLANAGQSAAKGTVESLEQAIALAQRLDNQHALHDKAQDLIARWQKEIEDVAHIQRARDLAQSEGVNELMAAIAEAQLVPRDNPRYEEARALIQRWTAQIQTVQDRPYLERADQLASLGDPASLQDAIEQANQIKTGRSLYQEARNKIDQWSNKIQRLQDQPILEQAENQANMGDMSSAIATAEQIRPGRVLYREAQSKVRQWTVASQRREDQPYLEQAQILASSGNLSGAIAAAQQIKSGRVLYDEAQDKIRDWQRELNAQQQLQSAFETASSGTPEALASAIRLARQVPRSSSVGGTARESSNRWSYQLLALAQERAANNVQEAIAIARTIPPRTEAYESAQLQIQAWERSLQPQPQALPPSF